MATITKADVEYVAELAQLDLDDETKERLVGELASILDHINQLNEVDTAEIEPMMHVLEVANVYREDAKRPSLPRDVALQNAPKTDGEHFIVPRILEQEGGA